MGGGYGRPFFMPSSKTTFPAVTIVTGSTRCPAVEAIEDMKILATHAPTLPMANCTMPEACRCRFKKYVDRRDDEQGRRFRLGQGSGAWQSGTQRRKSRGRRPKD